MSHGREPFRAGLAKSRDRQAAREWITRCRTPFEILDDFLWTGGDDDRIVWREYERATKGRQVITWSKGLRHLLAVTERTYEEIAAEEVGGEDLAIIHGDDWRHIVRVPGLASLILDRVEVGGLAAVNELLAHYGAGQAWQPAMLRYLE